jgi:dipeptidyl aminopeptidase/acylaminoacyl peptidase
VSGENLVLSQPAWVQGGRSYGWDVTGQKIYFTNYFQSTARLSQVAVASGAVQAIDISPYTWINQLTVHPVRDEVAFLAEAAHIPDQVVRWDGNHLHVEASSEVTTVSPGYFSHPRTVHWAAVDGTSVHGLYYPPTHPVCRPEGPPAAIVHVHSGPTSAATDSYESDIQFFTSRGYAWLEVNYRGSTGFGRSYQNALRSRWGDVDVEDAAGAARALAEQGLADGDRLAISGSSAGGFTVLNALIRYPGLFRAGICAYGVSDLTELDRTTHKFEKDYNAWLIGPLPDAAQRYHDRSPIEQADRIRDPLAIFQGSADPVVSPAQSERIAAVLGANQVPHLYVAYEGEGHRFRKAETINDYFEKMETFLNRYLGPEG